MKKQIKKLTLNKKTITNMGSAEMNNHLGGGQTHGCSAGTIGSCTYTCKGHTCKGGHNCV